MKDDKTIDALHQEMNQILAMMGSDKTTEEDRELARVRLSEISDSMVAISKRGDTPVYLINLLPKSWTPQRSYARFTIKPKAKNEQYGITEIAGKRGFIDTGRGGSVRGNGLGWNVKLDGLYWTAQQIADDLCREINGDLPALQSVQVNAGERIVKTMGVFVSPTRTPAPELLAKQRALLNVYMAALVEEGNFLWRKTHDYRQISDLSREAADYCGVSTEWHQNLALREFCQGCGCEIRTGVAKCMVCGAINNWDAAYETGMLSGSQIKEYQQRKQQVA